MNERLRVNIIFCAVWIAASVFVVWPLCAGMLLKTHDGLYAFVKSVSMHQSWVYGDFIGRWTPDINKGYGYPMFNFYAPLFAYVAACLAIFIHHLVWAHNVAIILVYIGSSCAMYLLAKEYWGRAGGFVSAIAYLFVPYHLLNLFIRGACGELMAMAMLPFAFYGIHRLSQRGDLLSFVISVLTLTGMILSHNITLMFFMPIFLGYIFCLWYKQHQFQARWFFIYAAVIILGFILTSYYWIPAFFEKGSVQVERNLQGFFSYQNHFIELDQLIHFSWSNGNSARGHASGMPMMLGLVPLLLTIILIFKYKRIENPLVRFLSGWWLIVLIGSIFMTLEASNMIWQAFKTIQFAQFPWRFLTIASFVLCLLSGGICQLFRGAQQNAVASVASFLIILASVPYCHAFGYEQLPVIKNAKDFLYGSDPKDNLEYLPKEMKVYPNLPEAPEQILFLKGDGKVLEHVRRQGTRHSYRYEGQTDALVIFENYYFPGWRAQINGKDFAIIKDNPLGVIMLELPKGSYQLDILFDDTPLRRYAQYVSIFGLSCMGILIAIIFVRNFSNKRFLVHL